MSITDKTRKILWAKSGNQCAFCQQKLVLEVSGNNTVVGEECHIISSKKNGPRYKKMDNYDEYDNLILLCSIHHKIIDDNEEVYTEEHLKLLKKNHENNIAKNNNSKESLLLVKADNVRDVVRCLHEAKAFATDYPEDKKEDYELFKEFFELVNNSDIFDDYDELSRIGYFEDIFNKISNKGYYIVIGNKDNYGKYKLDTAFVYIVTIDDYESNKINFF